MTETLTAASGIEKLPKVSAIETAILNNNLQDLRELNPYEQASPALQERPDRTFEPLQRFAANTLDNARQSTMVRYGTAAAAATALALTGGMAGAPKKAEAYPTFGSPELTLRELITVASYSGGQMCRAIAEIEAKGTYEKGKCSYISLYNCMVGGKRGQPHYNPPIRTNEGRCGTNFSVDFKNGEPIERGMRLVCQSRRVGVRKVKEFVRNREGKFYTRWRAVPDFRHRYTLVPRCVPTKL